MVMTDPQSKTIRTILENLFTDGYELGDSEITDCSVKPKAVDLALSDISKIIDEVIGVDEELGIRISDRVPAEISSPIIERNKFRAKMRVKLTEILGDVK